MAALVPPGHDAGESGHGDAERCREPAFGDVLVVLGNNVPHGPSKKTKGGPNGELPWVLPWASHVGQGLSFSFYGKKKKGGTH